MIKLTLTTLLSVIALASFAQKKFVIHGKIDLLTKSKNVRLSGYDPVPIKSDGTFEITGERNEPNIALILTDSSAASAIWLAPGEYTINCKEITLPDYKGVLFRTPFLHGPANAELFNNFNELQYSGYGTAGQKEKDPTSTGARIKERAIKYMDSVLKVNNSSPVLPNMIRSVQPFIGDEATKMLIQKLAPGLRDNGEIAILEQNFKRKEKIKKEKVFENFTLKDLGDSDFSLSALSGKKVILIDFWASNCGPCRAAHPRLKEWYAKYAAKGLEIISISIDDDKANWLKAVHDDGIDSWINVCDPNGFKASLIQDYYIPFIPFRFLLDENKNIVLVNNGQESWITEKDIVSILGN
ncbi:MAG: redoxin family protein [Chitinophagaceae bacterium]|nr:redoxin family protein [Chitinophagaceae bacterium]